MHSAAYYLSDVYDLHLVRNIQPRKKKKRNDLVYNKTSHTYHSQQLGWHH